MSEQRLKHFAFAAGDTMHDLPILERAAASAVVNPDPTLEELAKNRGREIVRTG